MTRRRSPPPDRHLRRPKLAVPLGACDCHFHIFGPQAVYPLHPECPVELEDSTFDDWERMQEALGLSRGLLVASGGHRYSYEHVLHWLTKAPDRLRGVVILPPEVTEGELRILAGAGVVGLRMFGALGINPRIDRNLIARAQDHGIHPHYLVKTPEQFMEWRDDILQAPGDFVLEHSGRPRPSDGLDAPQFKTVLDMLDSGRCWVKLSPRFSQQAVLPFADTIPFIQKLVAHAPDRMLWGTDWPHSDYFDPMPNDADLVDLMLEWVPDEAIRNVIFVNNPERLFRFQPPAADSQGPQTSTPEGMV